MAGRWTLQSINGTPLPWVVLQSGANKIEVTADVLTATGTGSFTQVTTVRNTLNGLVTTETRSDAGIYTLNGNAVTFVFNGNGSSGTGVLNGNTLNVGVSGSAFIYRKQ